MEIPEFVVENVFYKIEREDGSIVYWRNGNDDCEGYLVFWPEDGQHLHTYRYPPNIWG